MAKKAKGAVHAASDLFERLSAIARAKEPPDPITWIESHRRLSPEASREVGPFQFERGPYLVEPQRAILAPGGGEVVINWASQAGKTELVLNALLYWSANDPAPAMVITPDWKTAQSFSVDRVRPMLRDASLSQAEELRDPRVGNSVFHMSLGAMPLTIVHGSGASALAMRPIRYLVFDEASRLPASAKGRRSDEGDPVALAQIRTTTYGDQARILYTSSLIEEGACRITELFHESTLERWHSRCPHCGALQLLRLPEMDFESGTCRCLACGKASPQDAWQRQKGEWLADNPGHPRRGFWLNCFASPFVRWPVVFEEWRAAVHQKEQGDYAQFRVVLHTRLAENFTTRVELMSQPETLMARREDYGAEVPDSVRVIVAGIDTQATWLEWLACAIAPQSELFLLNRGQIDGRLESDAERIYGELDTQVLNRRWQRKDGKLMPLFRAFQDAGGAPGATGIVHRFCHQRAHVLSAYIGRASTDIVGPWKRTTSPQTHGRLFQANVSHYKQQLADKLGLEPGQPGSIHFGSENRGFDAEFFQQLLSEHKEIKLSRGVRTVVWKRVRDRNESLDLLIMILCLLDIYRSQIDRMTEPQIVPENGEKSTRAEQEPGRATWGAQAISTPDPYIQMLQREQRAQRPQQVPNRMRWGVQNRGIEL
jgi:phage terminase large subunit GpA-like protein